MGEREGLLARRRPAGQQHGDLNKGNEPMEVIVVEMKNDVKK